MLKGFSVPLTPQGQSALAKLPPWHYSSDCIAIEYWTDPARGRGAASARSGAGQGGERTGLLLVSGLAVHRIGDEHTDPARYQYREAFVLVEAVFEGKPINYCPYIFVDNDAAIARGWAQGFPKNMAAFSRPAVFPRPAPRPLRLPREAGLAQVSPRMGNGWQPRAFSWRRRSTIPQAYSIVPR